jgi:hypothetical protein
MVHYLVRNQFGSNGPFTAPDRREKIEQFAISERASVFF